MLSSDIATGNFYLTRIVYPEVLTQQSPLLRPYYDQRLAGYSIDAQSLSGGYRNNARPWSVLVVWVHD